MSEAGKSEGTDVNLTVPVESVCFVIAKLREFEAADAIESGDDEPTAIDDDALDELEESNNDTVEFELTSFIDAMSIDEQIDLVALLWLGRGDETADDWNEVRSLASDEHSDHTAAYLLGTPLSPDYLEEGLAKLGFDCED